MLNQAQKVRQEDKLNTQKLTAYLAENLDGFTKNTKLSIKQYAGGASNLTYLLEWNDKGIILRTAPQAVNIKSAHDMSREYNVLYKLNKHFKYAPNALHLCEDDSIIGRPFYLMQKVDGIILRRDFQQSYSQQQASRLCKNLIDVHVALHKVDIKQTGLMDLGHPQGYIARQVKGWQQRYVNAMLKDSLNVEDLMHWLREKQPADSDVTSCLIHNDYKLDNVVLSSQNQTKIVAVLDWEMATIGSPLMDLGCSLAYWIEASDSKQMQSIRMMPTNQKGMWSRQQIIEYYAQASHIEIKDFNFYSVFGLFRLAVIVQQIYKRYAQGKTSNQKFKYFGEIAKILLNQANKQIGL